MPGPAWVLAALLMWMVVGVLVGMVIGPILNENGKRYPPA